MESFKDFVLTKRQLVRVFEKEELPLKGREFIFRPPERGSWEERNGYMRTGCAVCAVGALLRHQFHIKETEITILAHNLMLGNAATWVHVEDFNLTKETITKQIQDPNLTDAGALSLLSQYFECVADQMDLSIRERYLDPNLQSQVRAEMINFVLAVFPKKIKVEIPRYDVKDEYREKLFKK